MNTTLRALVGLFCSAAIAHAADPVPSRPVDTTFLKQYAETRGFMLGRPQKPKFTPDAAKDRADGIDLQDGPAGRAALD